MNKIRELHLELQRRYAAESPSDLDVPLAIQAIELRSFAYRHVAALSSRPQAACQARTPYRFRQRFSGGQRSELPNNAMQATRETLAADARRWESDPLDMEQDETYGAFARSSNGTLRRCSRNLLIGWFIL
jgi:hypothetical protein